MLPVFEPASAFYLPASKNARPWVRKVPEKEGDHAGRAVLRKWEYALITLALEKAFNAASLPGS